MAVQNDELALRLLRLEEHLVEVQAELAGLIEAIEHGSSTDALAISEEIEFKPPLLRLVNRGR